MQQLQEPLLPFFAFEIEKESARKRFANRLSVITTIGCSSLISPAAAAAVVLDGGGGRSLACLVLPLFSLALLPLQAHALVRLRSLRQARLDLGLRWTVPDRKRSLSF